MQHHKYSLSELENMLPWERTIYVELLLKYLKEEKERLELQRQTKKQLKLLKKDKPSLFKEIDKTLTVRDWEIEVGRLEPDYDTIDDIEERAEEELDDTKLRSKVLESTEESIYQRKGLYFDLFPNPDRYTRD